MKSHDYVDFSDSSELAGSEVILIKDYARTSAPELEKTAMLVSDDVNGNLVVLEKDVINAQSENPTASVYGAWSVAIKNGLISKEHRVNVIRTSSSEGLWAQIDQSSHSKGKILENGEFKGNWIASLADGASSEWNEVDLKLDTLVLPENQARTNSDLKKQRKKKESQDLFRSALIGLCFIALSGVVYISVEFENLRTESKHADLRNKVAEGIKFKNSLMRNRVLVSNNYQNHLDDLMFGYLLDNNFSTGGDKQEVGDFRSDNIRLYVNKSLSVYLKQIENRFSVSYNIDGSLIITSGVGK